MAVLQQRQFEILRPAISRLRIAVADQLCPLRANCHRSFDLAARDVIHTGNAL